MNEQCSRCEVDLDAEEGSNRRSDYLFCDRCAISWDYWWKDKE